MTGFILALAASLCWGVSDFLGGLKTRTVPLPLVLAVSHTAGVLVLAVTVVVTGRILPAPDRLGYAVGAGLVSILALALLYAAMARGSMVVAAPIAASGVLIPVLVGVGGGEALGPLPTAGIALAVLGCVVASWEPGPLRGDRRLVSGALLAAAAAVAIGTFFVLFDAASADHPYAATFVLRLTSGLLALVGLAGYALARRPDQPALPRRLPIGTVLALVGIGVADAAAEIFFAVAAGSGLLSVTSVLASLYPVVTVALALIVLRERVHWLQFCGSATALAGVVLLALA